MNYVLFVSASLGDDAPTVWPAMLNNGPDFVTYQWSGLTAPPSDLGAPLSAANWSTCSVEVSGEFGANGILIVEGSNDRITYYTVNGNACWFTSSGVQQVAQLPSYVRARCIDADAATNLAVTVTMGLQ
jgi:hypothetical protein